MKSWIVVLCLCFVSGAYVKADVFSDPVFQDSSVPHVRLTIREIFDQSDSMEQLSIRAEMQRLGLSESAMNSAAVVMSPQEVTVVGLDSTLNESHLAYFGVRLGFPFVLGMNVMYRNLDPETLKNKFHIEFEAATSVIVSSLNMAFGYHLNQGPFYIGARLHYIYILNIFGGGGVEVPGFGPEMGWLIDLDAKKNWVASIRLGGVGFLNASNEFMVLPDVKVGIAVKLFGTR